MFFTYLGSVVVVWVGLCPREALHHLWTVLLVKVQKASSQRAGLSAGGTMFPHPAVQLHEVSIQCIVHVMYRLYDIISSSKHQRMCIQAPEDVHSLV